MKNTIAFEGSFNLKLESVTSQIAKSLIEGRNITLERGRAQVLKEINFVVEQDEHVVLVGPSGHGKSVLLKIMAGLLEISSGELYFEGERWSELSITQRNRHYLKRGMVFQKNALFDSMTVRENIFFPIHEVEFNNRSEGEKRALNILEEVGLSHALELYPHELSGGMQKRLGLARALTLRPPFLFLDDPVAGLDPITARTIIKLIKKLQSEYKVTCVSVLNDMNRAFELATRMWIVMEGSVTDLGAPHEAQNVDHIPFRNFLKGQPT
jgi:phospholipid/cholesterol/gamma-HCH transport system ATP-binding protein